VRLDRHLPGLIDFIVDFIVARVEARRGGGGGRCQRAARRRARLVLGWAEHVEAAHATAAHFAS
jgi:hypothetical protein